MDDGDTCQCPMGYNGRTCEKQESFCFADPCLNGGNCDYNEGNHTFSCNCDREYEGEQCQFQVENSCKLENNCTHDVECLGSLQEYTCICPEGLSGELCEVNANDCEDNPCQGIL